MENHLRIVAVTIALAVGIGVLISTPGFAQFKSGTQMVPLTVTVTDRAGRYVPDLPAAAFTIFEDGKPQTVSHFAALEAPVDLALLLDNSSSMRPDFPLAQEAACGLTRQLRRGDRVALSGIAPGTFNAQPMTGDVTRVEHAIRSMEVLGPTAIYEGIYVLLRAFQRERGATPDARRQAIVLLSDGLDTASHIEFDDVLDAVHRSDVAVYVVQMERDIRLAIETNESREAFQARFAMRALARESGARIFTPQSATELPAVYDAIARELGSQYLLGYVPARQDDDGRFHRIAVRVQDPRATHARTRAGYYAIPRPATSATSRVSH